MSEYIIEIPDYVPPFDPVARPASLGEEIVRCRDCKYATDKGYECKWFIHYEQCASYGWEGVTADVEPDGFCAWGKRRDA